MKVLLLGSGGREHALGWRLSRSPECTTLLSAPGNPGLADLGPVLPGLDVENPTEVVDAALAGRVDLVVVGPEAPLAAGVADALSAKGVPVFGPTASGARLESSKAFAKDIMERAGVPTAAARKFTTAEAAAAYLASLPGPYVVKADGLAAGKGVLVTPDLLAAQGWARICIEGHFGPAGSTVVVEEHLSGQEVSVFAICDGRRAVALEPARDYKRLGDGDSGPNTGGMGCYSPVSALPEGLVEDTLSEVVDPVLETLAEDGVEYVGFLYVGLMLTDAGPKVLEFNCRLGDPETQVLMPRLESDLLAVLARAADGALTDDPLRWKPTAAVDVVLAAPGYPESPRRGGVIDGIERAGELTGVHVFHAGTARTPDGLVVAGGRVLNVVGTGDDVAAARAAAYAGASLIGFDGMQFRTDIAGGER